MQRQGRTASAIIVASFLKSTVELHHLCEDDKVGYVLQTWLVSAGCHWRMGTEDRLVMTVCHWLKLTSPRTMKALAVRRAGPKPISHTSVVIRMARKLRQMETEVLYKRSDQGHPPVYTKPIDSKSSDVELDAITASCIVRLIPDVGIRWPGGCCCR